MRTYGRATNPQTGVKTWVKVETDAHGYNDEVWLTTLAQTLKLNLGESPFFANYGIPAHASVMTQIFPDFYLAFTQQQFSQYFAALLITKESNPKPTYNIQVTTNQGVVLMHAVTPI